MKAAGIIAEYNPFHEGHRYHIEETRRMTGADYIIIVMSGDFVQRGEPAIVDKYLRAEMALEGGADLVIEMPALYATGSAEFFATAGVGIMDSLGCVDYLSFGSEWASVEDLSDLSDLLITEPEEYKSALKKGLESGMNFPQAREEAVFACLPRDKWREMLRSPNHILAIEYMKALKRRGSSITPLVVRRKGSGYLSEEWNREEEAYPSATALRAVLRRGGDREILKKGCPACADLLKECMDTGETADWTDLMPYLDYMILMNERVLGKYFGMDYDLFHRILRLHKPGMSFEETVSLIHSKNYTDAALRRILLHIVLNMEEYPFMREASSIPLPYARVLGFRRDAGKMIRQIREKGSIPLLQRTVKGRGLDKYDRAAHILYDHDLRCADFYEQITAKKAGRDARSELIRNPVII